MSRQVRFKYAGTWTRWFSEGEDLSILLDGFDIEAMETIDEMPKEQAVEYLRSLTSAQREEK